MQKHEKYMQRCLELASLGLGSVKTNPMVGAVVVYDDKIIGEGYHQIYGQAHAEVHAIQQVLERFPDAEKMLCKATLYVNLEPCAHQGKTPPCAQLIIKHQIPKVVIANKDPFEKVDGQGIQLLRNAGIEVIADVLANEAKQLNKRFFCRVLNQRPYIVLKWAETNNGYFAPMQPSQQWISSTISKNLVHQWRTEESAVLVGFHTALIDNPQLNVRESNGNQPIRVVIDKKMTLPKNFNLFDSSQKTIIINELDSFIEGNNHYIQIPEADYYFYEKLVYQLYLSDIASVIIEGGKTTLQAFIDSGLWDEARVFSAKNIAWNDGIQSPILAHFSQKTSINLGEDLLTIFEK